MFVRLLGIFVAIPAVLIISTSLTTSLAARAVIGYAVFPIALLAAVVIHFGMGRRRS